MHLIAPNLGTRRRYLAGAIALLFVLLAGSAACAATVTVTQKVPMESVSPGGDVTGVAESSVGAQYTFVSFVGGQVTMKDATGLYRVNVAATDYVAPAPGAVAASPASSPAANAAAPVAAPAVAASPAPVQGAAVPANDPFATRLPTWSANAEQEWCAMYPTLAQEDAAAHAIYDQLAADYKKNGSSVFSQSDFQNWFDFYSWIKLGLDSKSLLAKPANFTTFLALAQDDAVSHLLVEKMTRDDDGPAALGILLRLAQANQADLNEYAALGVAYALVFDNAFPEDWPHGQVAHSAVPIGDDDPVVRFQFYVAANRAHQLDNDLTQLDFDVLKSIVDSKLSLAELTWAQQNTKTVAYSHFADAFFAIQYDKSRIQSESAVYDWEQPTYRLQDILKSGGICIDQAYFANMVGKARGIPTMMFTGLGDEGAHAWFGYLDRSGAWQLDCGRYENQDFAKGYTVDPQTWKELKDTDLQQLVKNGVKDPDYPAAHAALAWAYLQGNSPAAKTAYEDARTIMPNLAEAWRAEADYLDNSKASIDDLKTYYNAWISQVGPYPDQKVAAQQRFVALLRSANDPSADSVEQDIILENRNGGVDLAVQGAQEAIDDHLKAQDWDGARLEFERAVRDFGDSGGATFFYKLVEPYWRKCMSLGQLDLANKALRFTEERTSFNQRGADGKMTQIGEELEKYKELQTDIESGVPAVEAWLQQLDGGQDSQAWSSATPFFQGVAASDKWSSAVTAMRQSVGAIKSRDLVSASAGGTIHAEGQVLEGEFIMAKFTTTGDTGVLHEMAIFEKTSKQGWQAEAYACSAGPLPAATTAANAPQRVINY
jgi:Protein of unknown function (DUF4019)